MITDKNRIITVKPVFTGTKTVQEVFADIILDKIFGNMPNSLENSTKLVYNADNVIFSDVHAPRGENQ